MAESKLLPCFDFSPLGSSSPLAESNELASSLGKVTAGSINSSAEPNSSAKESRHIEITRLRVDCVLFSFLSRLDMYESSFSKVQRPRRLYLPLPYLESIGMIMPVSYTHLTLPTTPYV